MNHDHLDPINSLHVPELADMTFAMDFLIRAKEGVRNTAVALTETASPDVRALLRKQLMQGIAMHQEITDLMVSKKWFHPHDLSEQYKLDQLSAKNTLMVGSMNLFPVETNRKGMFDRTPDEH
ncbi:MULTISPECIES: spore coat protein [Bacillus]|uniref:Spore coat protein F n=2 Tax=Bacillus amyloliquefaciens group TaxID=1938374 RepID=I2C1V2_BACAY|nr:MULTISPECIES: spore coat protein [Bacillus]SLC38917.1 Spore coat protein F precursor [Mycobacteroides abscessus subsp. massiliense]AFJ60626.1 spore coat protein F [Bacillus velezensis YAU B9601-Y2]AIU80710.1 Spore coat protein F precursor [Bacillus velezensis]AJE77594.1 spore gernimation protein GerQ [Bacillus sp. BH072]APA01529.1 spore coat protein [Bacillus velezensis]